MDVRREEEIYKRVDRFLDILEKFAITYGYSQSPMAKGQMGPDAFPPAYNKAPGKGYGLNDRKKNGGYQPTEKEPENVKLPKGRSPL